MANANTAGATMNINALRRPIASDMKPLQTAQFFYILNFEKCQKLVFFLPEQTSEWMTDMRTSGYIRKQNSKENLILFELKKIEIFLHSLNLPSHDESSAAIRMVSFKLSVVNDGITIDAKPSKRLLFKLIEFFMTATITYGMNGGNFDFDFDFNFEKCQKLVVFLPEVKAVEMC